MPPHPRPPKPDELAEVLAIIRAWLTKHYPAWRAARLEADVGEPDKLLLPVPRPNVLPDTPPDS